MPFSFWFAIVFAVVALIGFAVAFFKRKDRGSDAFPGGIIIGCIAGVLAVIGVLVASANTVPVRNVGIVTSFSRPTGETTGSGLKWVAPWKKVSEWDASIQTADHTGDHCVTARIGSLATVCVENKVRWQVRPEAAPEQYMAYKGDFENMKLNLFETELQDALNEALSDYNPLSSLDLSTGQTTFDGTALAEEVKKLMETRVGNQIVIESVVIPLVRHDAKTEENIKAFQDVIAQKRILEQKLRNAETEKAAAELLRDLPGAYTMNKCLDLAKEMGREPGLCVTGATTFWQANK